MAATLDATIGGLTANSYASVADADVYHETHPYADTWEGADDDEKVRALITATRLLDLYVEWFGIAASYTQALGWPRYSAYGLNGYVMSNLLIPDAIVNATAEFSRQLLAGDRTADPEFNPLKRLKAGPVELEWKGEEPTAAEVIPDIVLAMIGPFGTLRRSRNSAGTVALIRD